MLDQWLLAPAAMHDSQVMPSLFDQVRDHVGIGDDVVHNSTQAPVLAMRSVVVDALQRRDSAQGAHWPPYVGRRLRALSAVFDVQRSPKCVVCCISARVLAYTFCFAIQPLLVHFRSG